MDDRRAFLLRVSSAVPAVTLMRAAHLSAQPVPAEQPPASDYPLDWESRIASDREPGEPMTFSGMVCGPDGKTPAIGVVIYAYHTDVKGLYRPDGSPGLPRLRGWARTNHEGRYEFRSIRPAPYPGGGIAAHVHLSAGGAGYAWKWLDTLEFAGDPYLREPDIERARTRGRFSWIRSLVKEGGVWQTRHDIRL